MGGCHESGKYPLGQPHFPRRGCNRDCADHQRARRTTPIFNGRRYESVTRRFLDLGGFDCRGQRDRNHFLASLQPGEKSDVGSNQTGLNWIWMGVGLSCVVLLLTVVWTVLVLADVETPGIQPAVTLEITGRQWFWEARYLSPNPSQIFTTANEFHIPAGEPVRLKLIGGDVIHSFWVPQLAGKMDAIPGVTNETWFEATAPGVYRGQCTEYCGVQHAHMGIIVIADTPANFKKWWDHQLQSPTQPASDGADLFEAHCGGCHTVRGTDAAGTKGPDLSHLMSRSTIAAGFLPNNGPNLARWVSDPQSVKPGSFMPTPEISGAELKSIDTYLQTLR
jgi:cytochrome c oxidase subunit 2